MIQLLAKITTDDLERYETEKTGEPMSITVYRLLVIQMHKTEKYAKKCSLG